MANYQDVYLSKYVSPKELGETPGAKTAKITIQRVTIDTFNAKGGKQNKIVIWFHAKNNVQRGIALSKTGADDIARLLREDDYEKWPGFTVEAFTENMTAFGETFLVFRFQAAQDSNNGKAAEGESKK